MVSYSYTVGNAEEIEIINAAVRPAAEVWSQRNCWRERERERQGEGERSGSVFVLVMNEVTHLQSDYTCLSQKAQKHL